MNVSLNGKQKSIKAKGCRQSAQNCEKRKIDEMAVQAPVDTVRPRAHRCYLWGILFPIQYLFLVGRDRQDPFLRFHCVQCLLLFVMLIPILIWIDKSTIASLALLVWIVGYLVALIQAWRRKMGNLPALGGIAEHLAGARGTLT